VSEAERAQAVAAGELGPLTYPSTREPPPEPRGGIPVPPLPPPPGTDNLSPDELFRRGYVYLRGQWVKVLGVNPDGTTKYEVYAPTGLPTATTMPSLSSVPTSGMTIDAPTTMGAIIEPFVGGPIVAIRMTTGLGAEVGALAPIRMGISQALLPRIIMNEVAT